MCMDKIIVEAVSETMSMFGMNLVFDKLIVEDCIPVEDNINISIDLYKGLEGRIVLGLNENTALRIVSAMMGGMQVQELDSMAESALGELLNMTAGSAVAKLNHPDLIDISTPIIIKDNELGNDINKERYKNFLFRIEDQDCNIFLLQK